MSPSQQPASREPWHYSSSGPPTIEEIVAVPARPRRVRTRAALARPHRRLWRAGLRMSEAHALAEADHGERGVRADPIGHLPQRLDLAELRRPRKPRPTIRRRSSSAAYSSAIARA